MKTTKKTESKEDKKTKIDLIDKKTMEEKLDNDYFHARVILEMVGKPKNHIEETLLSFIEKISKDSRYFVYKYETEEPIEMEGSEELFSTFGEVEFVTKDMTELMNFTIDYMPASVEVLHPANVTIQANFLSNLMTELVGRLHLIDDTFRKANAKSSYLSKSLGIMIQNSILILLNLGPKTKEKISEIVGIEADQTLFFLEKLVKDEKIVFDEDNKTYSLKLKK